MQFYVNIILDIENQQDVMIVNMREVVTNDSEEKKERIIAHNNYKYKIGMIRCSYTCLR